MKGKIMSYDQVLFMAAVGVTAGAVGWLAAHARSGAGERRAATRRAKRYSARREDCHRRHAAPTRAVV
jgi:hypothetical protein